jgi:hypothetical protein
MAPSGFIQGAGGFQKNRLLANTGRAYPLFKAVDARSDRVTIHSSFHRSAFTAESFSRQFHLASYGFTVRRSAEETSCIMRIRQEVNTHTIRS